MLEWGFLLARLPAYRISVYLVGLKRSDLPSDLHGAVRIFEIPSYDDFKGPGKLATEQSKSIVNHYTKQEEDPFAPSFAQIFYGWPQWRKFLLERVQGEAYLSPKATIRVLTSAFFPISYYPENDLELYDQALNAADVDSQRDVARITVAKGIVEYLKHARRRRIFLRGDFDNIKKKFAWLAQYKDPYVSLLTRYTMGLCLYSESFTEGHDDEGRRRLRRHALDDFEYARSIVECTLKFSDVGMKRIRFSNESSDLWRMIICGNIVRTLIDIKAHDAAIEEYKKYMKIRMGIQMVIAKKAEQDMQDVFRIETRLHLLRLGNLMGELSSEDLVQAGDEMRAVSCRRPHVFRVLEKEIKEISIHLNA